ncbi:MAG: SusC/RagA family TonB-linked outer membrane protein [Sediminibacterium sp.]
MTRFTILLTCALLMVFHVSAQTSRTIIGKVTDQKGVPLTGVTISSVGANKKVLSDNSGNFSIQVSEKVKALLFSYVGYENKEVATTGLNSISVSLSLEDKSLNDVVVVGYGTQKKRDITGSIASVKGDALANKPTQSFEQALGGRAAGVQVVIPSGVLNAPPVLRIRGTNSISLSSYPLIVVDGVPVFTGDGSSTNAAGNVLSSINPNDIESVDVAKDAAATAIYGSRAANGVLFITTKKGKPGRSKVTLDSWVGFSNPQRLQQVLDAQQYTDYKNEALRNAGTYNAATNAFATTMGPDGKIINTNWADIVYRQGLQHSNTVSLSGANEATSYYFSTGYTEQQGIINKNDFKRLTLLMNIDHKAGKFFSMGGKIQYTSDQNTAAASSGSLGDAFATAGLGRVALVTAPNVGPYLSDGSYNQANGLIGVMGNKLGQVGFYNPQISMDLNRSNSYGEHLVSNLYAQFKPVNWLAIRTQYGIDYLMVDNDLFSHPLSGEGFSSTGSVSAIYNKNKRWVWTTTAQFDKVFAEKHSVSALLGIEHQKSDNNSYGLNRVTVSDPAFTNIQGGWATPNPSGLGIGENYLYSEFARGQYNYARKYFLTANVRRDGASQLGVNSKYGIFWGVSASWDVLKEKFAQNLKFDKVFSSFRLRGSYGKVGNIGGLGNFASLSSYGSGLYGGGATVGYSQAGNPNLTWETSKKTDVGLNFGLFNDRLTAEVGYYNSNNDGLLLFVPQPPSAGLPSSIPTNIGSMYNRGFEFDIKYAVIEKKDFSWTTSFNLSTNDNKVLSLAPGITNIIGSTGGLETPSITVPGQPIGMIFVTRTAGVDAATGRRIFVNSLGRQVFFQHVAPAGQQRFMYADGTTAPTVSSADAIVYKNTNAKIFGGWENNFRYKNFELNALFTYQMGNWLYYGTQAGLRDQRFWNNEIGVLNRWQKPGDITEFPKPIFGDNVSNGSSFPLDINVYKGDFIKLRTLTIGYNLPKSMLEKVKISNARFYVSGNNLMILTAYPGPDPEVSSNGNGTTNFGIDRNTVANQRTITVGINVGF